MTKVDFYILPSADPSARLDFACKLTEKAWRMGHRIYLHCSDAGSARRSRCASVGIQGRNVRAAWPGRQRTGRFDRFGIG